MKINCAAKLRKALDFARAKDEKRKSEIRKRLFQAFQEIEDGHNDEAQKLIEEITNIVDSSSLGSTLIGCLSRIVAYEANSEENYVSGYCSSKSEYSISSDFGEHTFFFSENREDGRQGLCGGIVYHGCPEEGYKENGSVSLSPEYGWQIHT